MKEMTVYLKEATEAQPINSLEAALVTTEGIERALVDVSDREVKIVYDENQITKETVLEKIKEQGFHSIS